jgi:hypothetical protein
MSTPATREWPTQLRLPGQAAAPEGPVDAKMMYIMHHAFRRDLRMFAAAAAVTPAGDRDAWRALARRWEIFSGVLHDHHTGEDTGLWPVLLDLAGPDERATLHAMEDEHAGIDPVLTDCAAGFRAMTGSADEATRVELASRLVAARDALGAHLEHEERDAMALVQKYLTTEDWHHIEETHFRAKKSLADLTRVVPWAVHGLPADSRREAFREVGLPFELLWRATRRRFERFEARATRHLR